MYSIKLVTLTEEKFNQIYTNEKFRNQVAYAHKVIDKNGNVKYMKTCSYPTEYIVKQEHINIAQAELNRAKEEKLSQIGNKLVFVGMGMTYEGDDVGNYRIRTNFLNPKGEKFFIELSSAGSDGFPKRCHILHSIKKQLNFLTGKEDSINNFARLEEKKQELFYTKESILNFINSIFNCNFREIEIDSYTLAPETFVCVSP